MPTLGAEAYVNHRGRRAHLERVGGHVDLQVPADGLAEIIRPPLLARAPDHDPALYDRAMDRIPPLIGPAAGLIMPLRGATFLEGVRLA
jgi:hypothetical protein